MREFNDLHDGFDIFPQLSSGNFFISLYAFILVYLSRCSHFFSLYFFLPLLFCCIYGNEVLEQYKLVKFLFANDLSPIQ